MTVAVDRTRFIHRPRVVSWIVAAVFVVVYAFFLWGGISNLIGVVATFATYGIPVDGNIWALLIGYAATPVVLYFVALVVGLRLAVLHRVIVFLVGLGVVGVVSLALLSIA